MHFARSQELAGVGKKGSLILLAALRDIFIAQPSLMPSVKLTTYLILLYLIFQIFRVWMFPPTSLSTAEEVLREVPGLAVEVLLYM
jgi:hypothetical protein